MYCAETRITNALVTWRNHSIALCHTIVLSNKRKLQFSNVDEYDSLNSPCVMLSKICSVYQHLRNKFPSSCKHEKDITVDESALLVLYKGRVESAHYIPLKTPSFTIQFYMLCESIRGFVWSLITLTEKTYCLIPNMKTFLCFRKLFWHFWNHY